MFLLLEFCEGEAKLHTLFSLLIDKETSELLAVTHSCFLSIELVARDIAYKCMRVIVLLRCDKRKRGCDLTRGEHILSSFGGLILLVWQTVYF